MVEKYNGKTNFIERLHLPSDVEQAVLDYHVKVNNLSVTLDERDRTDFRGILDTYSELLLIARSPYYCKLRHKGEDISLVDVSYEWTTNSDLRRYFVRYKPEAMNSRKWFSLCDAFGDSGFLRPFAKDGQSLIWAEVDYVFKLLSDYYTSSDYYETPFVIGCFNPRTHDDYEAFDRILGTSDVERLLRYLSIVSLEYVGGFHQLLYDDYRMGDFERWIMDDEEKRRMFSRSEVIANVNRIYLGEKVTIEV